MLESLAQEPGGLIVELVVAEIQVSEDLRLQDVLRNLTGTGAANLVVGQVQLGDCLVQDEPLRQDSHKVVIDQVAGQRQIRQ